MPQPSSNPNTPNPDLLTTTQVYRPISTLQEAHDQAVLELHAAVARGDEATMKQAFDTIMWVEQQQQQAASNIFRHIVQKARARYLALEGGK